MDGSNMYEVTFYYHSTKYKQSKSFTERIPAHHENEIYAAVKNVVEKHKFIDMPGGLIPVSCIGEIIIKKVD